MRAWQSRKHRVPPHPRLHSTSLISHTKAFFHIPWLLQCQPLGCTGPWNCIPERGMKKSGESNLLFMGKRDLCFIKFFQSTPPFWEPKSLGYFWGREKQRDRSHLGETLKAPKLPHVTLTTTLWGMEARCYLRRGTWPLGKLNSLSKIRTQEFCLQNQQ